MTHTKSKTVQHSGFNILPHQIHSFTNKTTHSSWKKSKNWKSQAFVQSFPCSSFTWLLNNRKNAVSHKQVGVEHVENNGRFMVLNEGLLF